MAVLRQLVVDGCKNAGYVMKQLALVMVPVYFGIKILEASGALAVISHWLTPVMSLVGLPGEASLPLVLGASINLYSLIGGVAALSLTAKQLTILGAISLFAHALIMEGAVLHRAGANAIVLSLVRLLMGFSAGFVLNLVL